MNHNHDPEANLAMAYIKARLADPRIEAHFTKNAHKQAATRELLELFDVPLPGWARRSLSGPAARNKAMMDRFKADDPMERLPKGYQPKPR
jgi:hypothetical protein